MSPAFTKSQNLRYKSGGSGFLSNHIDGQDSIRYNKAQSESLADFGCRFRKSILWRNCICPFSPSTKTENSIMETSPPPFRRITGTTPGKPSLYRMTGPSPCRLTAPAPAEPDTCPAAPPGTANAFSSQRKPGASVCASCWTAFIKTRSSGATATISAAIPMDTRRLRWTFPISPASERRKMSCASALSGRIWRIPAGSPAAVFTARFPSRSASR